MIDLRKKTTNALSEETCRSVTALIEAQIEHNNHLQTETVIWELTYMPTEAIQKYGFEGEMPPEQITVIRNELASQFRKANKEWTYGVRYKERYKDNLAFDALGKALQGDSYSLDEVVSKCIEHTYKQDAEISKTIACLKSTWETTVDKGFRRLGFGPQEESFLLLTRLQIAEFLESICKERMEAYRQWYNESQKAKQQEVSATAAKPVPTPKVVEANVKEVTPKELINSRKAIEKFFASYDSVSNPQWLIDNRVKVEELFKALDQI